MSNWRRRLTLIYDDNHKFGASLYSDAIEDIEKKYRSSVRSTNFRSDRPDLMSQTIYQSSSIGSSRPASESGASGKAQRPASMYDAEASTFEHDLRQLNSKSNWDLRQSRLQADKGTAFRNAQRNAPCHLYRDVRYQDSIFVGPRGYRIFF